VRKFRPQLQNFYLQMDWSRTLTENFALDSTTKFHLICSWLLKRGLRTSSICYTWHEGLSRLMEKVILANAHCIKTVHMYQESKWEDMFLECLAQHCTHLECLCYVFSGDTYDTIGRPLSRMSSLRELSLNTHESIFSMIMILQNIHLPSITQLTLLHHVDTRLAELAVAAFPNVSTLRIDSLVCAGLRTMSALPAKSLFIRSLQAPHAGSIEHNAFAVLEELEISSYTSNTILSAVLANAPHLHTVKLSTPAYMGAGPCLGSELLQLVSTLIGARLQVLELCMLNGMCQGDLHMLAERCPNLRQLDLNFCQNSFNDRSTLQLLPKWPKLTHFQISSLKCSVALLHALVTHCPLLESVIFEDYQFKIDLAFLVEFIRQAKSLKSIWLGEEKYPVEIEAFSRMYREQEQMFKDDLY